MSKTIVHADDGFVDRLLRRAFARVAVLVQSPKRHLDQDYHPNISLQKTGRKELRIRLPRASAFLDQFSISGATQSDLRKVVENERAKLSPLDVSSATLLTKPGADGRLDLLHLHTDELLKIEQSALDAGATEFTLIAEDDPNTEFRSPGSIRAGRLRRFLWVLSLTSFLFGVSALLGGIGTILERRAVGFEADEISLRSELLARSARARDLGALGALAELNPQLRSPQGRMEQLAELNQATPDSAWWSEIEIDGDKAIVSLEAKNAPEVLTSFENTLESRTARFEGALADTPNGTQIFKIVVTPEADE